MDPAPLVSIVTPCFNAGRFLARTIESVLAQDYPRIEYIVMDGGSTDETPGILEGYGGRLQYLSARDGGAADAINRGFLRSAGSIFAWLNADDTYFPGAISAAVHGLLSAPEAAVAYGEGLWIDERGEVLGRYPTVTPYHRSMFERECGICQPASFLRREAFAAVGMLHADLQLAFDYDLWIRLSLQHRFVAVRETLAASRMHRANKSLGQKRLMFQENIGVLRRYYRYVPVNWVYGYLSFLRDGRDQYFEPLRHSALVYLASLAAGSYYNRRHLLRYWSEWFSHIGAAAWRRLRESGGKGAGGVGAAGGRPPR
ncbi:MAG: glycosyltransferase [Acidobacteriia bacterium]|nr:glycosyltransferase [Terriglobia bacterium]